DKSKNDTDNHNINVNKMELKVGDSSNNWVEVQAAVDLFAKKKLVCGYKDLDPVDKSIFRRHSNNC
ncbi:46458_t:CDS:1, partial [Gigaspora margarita]